MTPPLDPNALGLFIGRKRDAYGMSQGALAKAAGISRPYLSQIESGKRDASEEVFTRLMLHLGSPYAELLDALGDAVEPEKRAALQALLAPTDQLAQVLDPDELLRFMGSLGSMEQILANLATLAPEPVQLGPDGWTELDAEDRRLVQRIVNRLRKAREAE